MLSSNAVVVRDGQRKQIPAEELVPGDIVVIKSGDKIPADVRLIQTANLQVGSCGMLGVGHSSDRHVHTAALLTASQHTSLYTIVPAVLASV
jgi:hypothetical protein